LTDDQFADGYAQTVTFGLLLARRSGVDFTGLSAAEIGSRLTKKHLLVGRALSILTENPAHGLGIEERSIAVRTLRRVISVSEWSKWLESSDQLYEQFLELYDPILRRRSGSYFTPPEVTDFVVDFVDSLLQERLGRRRGLANRDVVIIDPAMGSGTFLLSAMNRVALNVVSDHGDERAELRDLLPRLIGFEIQIAPFAVAELKLHQLLASRKVEVGDERVRFYVTDTLDDPDVEALSNSPVHYEPIAESRRLANHVKTDERVMVVFGNPPYQEQAKIQGGIILSHVPGRASLLDSFRGRGTGRFEIKLHNMNIYFWRWASWKVFEAHADRPE
jgi:predicted helicase